MHVVQSLNDGLAHHAGASRAAIEAREGAHLEDGWDTASFLAQKRRPRVHELDFGRGIGAIAEFVLEALDINAVEASIGEAPRHEETGQSAATLRQHQVSVALRRRKKPFMPGDSIGAVARTERARGIRPYIGTALLFRHAHADQATELLLERDIARIVFAREQPRHPITRKPGVP